MNRLIARCIHCGLLASLSLSVMPATADEKVFSWSYVDFDHSLNERVTNGAGNDLNPLFFVHGFDDLSDFEPYPLDHSLPGAWNRPHQLSDPEYGLWAYANEVGRVRTRVKTGKGDPASGSPLNSTPFGHAHLVWIGRYVRDSIVDPTFTLNPSHLEVRASVEGEELLLDRDGTFLRFGGAGGFVEPPYASMKFSVTVRPIEPSPHGFTAFTSDTILSHRSKLSGIVNHPATPLGLEYSETRGINFLLSRDGEEVHPLPTDLQEIRLVDPCVSTPRPGCEFGGGQLLGYRYEVGGYSESIDLDKLGIKTGDMYEILYWLNSQAGEDEAEHYAESYLADPLDNDGGGFELTTDHTPAEGPAQICDEAQDALRFENHDDGTVTDTRTGLMWQRCPAGFALDDNGTVTDQDDDTCSPGATPTADWRSALQAAAADDLAGHDDWRLPNVKELASLVAPGCWLLAIDRLAFPDTPPRYFWTSTPFAGDSDEASWSVNFLAGDTGPVRRSGAAHTRLVRDSGTTPVLPRPAVRVRSAAVDEGPAGSTALLEFLVELSHPIGESVTMDYRTEPLTATEPDDYQPTAGTLTIPAGLTRATVAVTVNGDDVPEFAESFRLRVDNVSVNANLALQSAEGFVLDDESHLRVAGRLVEHLEGDSGSSIASLVVELDRAATAPVTVDFETIDGTASAGSDYTAASGSLVFNVGDDRATAEVLIAGDTGYENDDTFRFELSSPTGAHLIEDDATAWVRIVDDDGPGTFAAVNDTGVRHCADATNALLSCPQAGIESQDGDIGRDATVLNQEDGDGGFSFTKLDASGADLPFSAPTWSCMRDEVTGLVWENKNNVFDDLHNADATYTWYSSTGINDGGDPGVAGGGACTAGIDCDTESFVAAVNAEALCGFDDWRLPTVDEAFDIANMAVGSNVVLRGMDAIYFPNVISDRPYATSTPTASAPTLVWAMLYRTPDSIAGPADKSDSFAARLVRGGSPLRPPS